MAVKKENETNEMITISAESLKAMIDAAVAEAVSARQIEKETSATEVYVDPKKSYWEEKVEIELFYDGDKYKDDLQVGINGVIWNIKRGVPIKVPRYVAQSIKDSEEQDRKTALMVRELEKKYETESEKILG